MFIFIDLDKAKDKGIIKSDFLDNIREHFSEEDEKAGLKKHLFKSRARFFSSRKYVITQQGRFDLGLFPAILTFLKSLDTPFKLVFSEEFKERYNSRYSFANENILELDVILREYQRDGVKKGLLNGNGIFLYPTGSGKTLLMASIIHNIKNYEPQTKTLVITLTHLINQIYDEFISYGLNPQDICKWSGTNDLNPDAKIVICGNNILYSKIENTALEIKKAKLLLLTLEKNLETDFTLTNEKRTEYEKTIEDIKKDILKLKDKDIDNKKIHDFFETINLLVIDEVHTLKKENEITNILKYISTRHRYGFTGTLPESKIDEWNIIGKIGPVIYEVPRDHLVENKFITDVDIKILFLDYKEVDMTPTENEIEEENIEEEDEKVLLTAAYNAELDFLHTNVFRNTIIKKITEKLDKNCLIVVDRLFHGETLKTFLEEQLPNKKVYFIEGKVEDEDRDKIKALMERDNNIICIAVSKIFSTGINIKNLHYLIFAAIGKAKNRIIQTIGRGVRTLEGKTMLVIFDLADNRKYGVKHLKKRIQIYDKEKFKYTITKISEV